MHHPSAIHLLSMLRHATTSPHSRNPMTLCICCVAMGRPCPWHHAQAQNTCTSIPIPCLSSIFSHSQRHLLGVGSSISESGGDASTSTILYGCIAKLRQPQETTLVPVGQGSPSFSIASFGPNDTLKPFRPHFTPEPGGHAQRNSTNRTVTTLRTHPSEIWRLQPLIGMAATPGCFEVAPQ
jgi:hypothetical protein